MNKGLLTSNSEEWYTPLWLCVMIEDLFGGVVGLDPCASVGSPLTAKVKYYKADNGLEQDWKNKGSVFMNPPYGRAIGLWVHKACAEAEELLMLLPARTDTKWFLQGVQACSALCFLQGRLKFGDGATSAPFPSVLLFKGSIDRTTEFVRRFSHKGITLPL